jgi:hypothetical protein
MSERIEGRAYQLFVFAVYALVMAGGHGSAALGALVRFARHFSVEHAILQIDLADAVEQAFLGEAGLLAEQAPITKVVQTAWRRCGAAIPLRMTRFANALIFS